MDDDEDTVIYCGQESTPITSLDDLLSWTEPCAPEGVNGSLADDGTFCYRIPKRIKRAVDLVDTTEPLTLVCHDMKGGYLEDRHNNGHDCVFSYRFTYWSLVDIFIYFSHHLVSVPPLAWTTAAHRNGVRSFGTFLIEEFPGKDFDEDRFLRDFHLGRLGRTLADEESVDRVASTLARIAAFYRFDGWLVNMEGPIPREKVPLMERLLRSLKIKTKAALGVPENDIAVIWYDAVTADDGKLVWQNELNARNELFFAASDAIFLNYTWTPEHLARSVAHLKGTYGEEKGEKLRNRIFVGIDVFGRGCFGGGGFFSHVALEEARRLALSAAIFAPGWTWEHLGTDDWSANDHRFWGSLGPHITERAFSLLPIKSTFCEGVGLRRHEKGVIVDGKPWCDLRRQSTRPCFVPADVARLVTSDAWQGGGCLQVVVSEDAFNRSFTLFKLAVPVENKTYHFRLVSKISHPEEMTLKTTISFEDEVGIYLLKLDFEKEFGFKEEFIRSIIYSHEELNEDWTAEDFIISLNEKVKKSGLMMTSLCISLCLTQVEKDSVSLEALLRKGQVLLGELTLEEA